MGGAANVFINRVIDRHRPRSLLSEKRAAGVTRFRTMADDREMRAVRDALARFGFNIRDESSADFFVGRHPA